MTYAELLARLLQMNEEQLSQNVTVYLSETDEYFAVSSMENVSETDILDEGHSFLNVPT